MATTKVEIDDIALRKSISHILKYHKSDCIGILLGQKAEGGRIQVTDAVPLFHDRVMTSAIETAMEMIECVYTKDKTRQIVGLYDAPLRVKNDPEQTPLSTLAVTMAEQIKTVKETLDTVVI